MWRSVLDRVRMGLTAKMVTEEKIDHRRPGTPKKKNICKFECYTLYACYFIILSSSNFRNEFNGLSFLLYRCHRCYHVGMTYQPCLGIHHVLGARARRVCATPLVGVLMWIPNKNTKICECRRSISILKHSSPPSRTKWSTIYCFKIKKTNKTVFQSFRKHT